MNVSNLKYAILLVILSVFIGCSKDSNPAVPSAPIGDVISIAERNPAVKIGLTSFSPQKNIFVGVSRGSFNCYVGDSLEPFGTGFGSDIFKFTGTEKFIEFYNAANAKMDLNSTKVRIEAAAGAENGFVMVGASKNSLKPYRGVIRLVLEGKNILVINEIQLEDYLTGVVPAEMDPNWNKEALKAQAVASRTYALFNIGKNRNRGYDITDDSRYQLYGGAGVETEFTDAAVIETTNEVLTFENALACITFHEQSVGSTANVTDIWPKADNLPYLVSIDDKSGNSDYGSGGKFDSWSSFATLDELRTALNRYGETFVGEYLSALTLLGQSESGRIRTIHLDGEKKHVVDSSTLSFVLNRNLKKDFLPSNKFTLKWENDGYRFSGSGSGNGVGMSQWGAQQRASLGQDYKFILSQYYPGCEIKEIPIDGISVTHNLKTDMIH